MENLEETKGKIKMSNFVRQNKTKNNEQDCELKKPEVKLKGKFAKASKSKDFDGPENQKIFAETGGVF